MALNGLFVNFFGSLVLNDTPDKLPKTSIGTGQKTQIAKQASIFTKMPLKCRDNFY